MSKTESVTQSIAEYSWEAHKIFIHVIAVHGKDESSTLLRQFHRVIQYHDGRGEIEKTVLLLPHDIVVIFGAHIISWIMCICI